MLDREIVTANQLLYGDKSIIRSLEGADVINEAFKDALACEDTKEVIIHKTMRLAALIKLFQPFYDGNNRTAVLLIGYILNKKGITFNTRGAMNEFHDHKLIIPTIYDIDDNISERSISSLDNYIGQDIDIKER
jgi:hypothetical protein